eukprot:Platyproteum_vivax@DN12897_c0_g1_i1.p2
MHFGQACDNADEDSEDGKEIDYDDEEDFSDEDYLPTTSVAADSDLDSEGHAWKWTDNDDSEAEYKTIKTYDDGDIEHIKLGSWTEKTRPFWAPPADDKLNGDGRQGDRRQGDRRQDTRGITAPNEEPHTFEVQNPTIRAILQRHDVEEQH